LFVTIFIVLYYVDIVYYEYCPCFSQLTEGL